VNDAAKIGFFFETAKFDF